MANTRSAKKMIRKIARKTAINRNRRTALRSIVKKVEEALATGDKAGAQVALAAAEPALARAANRKLIHKNTASRKIARLTRRVGALASR